MAPEVLLSRKSNASTPDFNWVVRPRPVEWAALVVGLVMVLRYRWLMDDAFVYFRYLDNYLFLKVGLVFNQGEFVEGFSSPAWLLLLLPLRAIGLDFWLIVLTLGMLFFVVFWYLLVCLNRWMAPAGAVYNLPLLYLVSTYAVACYFTSGLETPWVQLMGVVFALYILNPSSRGLEAAVAFAPLVRHELALPLVLVAAWSWYVRRRPPLRLIAMTGAIVGAWLLFRIYYYADLFPNTFYLKNDLNPGQGLVYLNDTLVTYRFYLVMILIGLAVLVTRKRQDDRGRLLIAPRLMMLLVAASVTAYVVKIGGDPRHFRFLAFPFSLAVCSWGGILERFVRPPVRHGSWAALTAGAVLMVVFLSAYPPQLDRHPFTRLESHERVEKISDASYHRHMQRLQAARWRDQTRPQAWRTYRDEITPFRYREIRTGFWCVGMYREFDTRVVHSLGLTDAFLARTMMESQRPAHKWGLSPMAKEIVALRQKHPGLEPGTMRRAVEQGDAPRWVLGNLETIEVIERKVHNRHRFLENLELAFSVPGRIDPTSIRARK